ncbi:MAG: alpha/beta fold hydrolase, partial [Gammaproteobacteria bacterium]|nr:alpha/beta fold hydrolase [Gammaproteobacteria bacterium]
AALEETSCRLLHELLPAEFAQCAELVVPLDHSDSNSPSVALFVARVPATTATPEPDPLVLINGGPGGSSVDLYLQNRGAFAPVLRDRDIVLLDQRGTGRSLSGLDCDLPEDFELVTSTRDEIRAIVDACIAEFPFDPRFFTTSVAVEDLELLRQTLGVDEWNIYGISYGTRVAQHYLRRHGEHVRTMILDGVVPAELTLGPAIATDAQTALDAIFARCAASAPCAARFASLRGQFDELRQRFDNGSIEVFIDDPVTGEPTSLVLDESHLQGVVRLMSYSDATVALLPLVIDETYRGNYRPLAAQAELQIQAVSDSIGFAMHNSVVCTEDAPYFDRVSNPDATWLYLGTTVVDGLRAICESWPAGVIDDDFKDAVESARPVLLLSGEHDPVTPPSYAERVIDAGLTNARHIVGPAQGHGLAGVGCMPRLIREFIETADLEALDSDCVDAEPPMPFFLNFQGPSP